MASKNSSESPNLGAITTSGPGNLYLRPELRDVKVIGVEEHVMFPDILAQVPGSETADYAKATLGKLLNHEALVYARGRTTDLGTQRLRDMDEGGVAVQVLSFGSPINTTHFEPSAALKMAQQINDRLKAAVDKNPTRFKALAELPAHSPREAALELRRCVKELGFVGAMIAGSIEGTGKFLDRPEFQVLLSEFEELDVPLYLHPGITPEPIQSIYYDIPGNTTASAAMGAMAWGWHNEVAIHVLRLAVSGTLDRHPNLKLVVGHQGEMMPMMMQRFDSTLGCKTTGLERNVGEALRKQVWIAISGMFSLPITQLAIQTWGVDRVLFANDYPFVDAQRVPEYIRALNDIVGPSDMKKILQTNTEDLFQFKA
ncbi:hypothetical protein NHJ13051_008030 [Beauveria bassiana]